MTGDNTSTPYRTVFEGMYSDDSSDPIAPVFSLALQRGEPRGYVSFGGLPPVDFEHDFAFTPFQRIDQGGEEDPHKFYPTQPDGFSINDVFNPTEYRVAVDSGPTVNRLPRAVADQISDSL